MVRLISIANIHYAKHIRRSGTIASKNLPIIGILRSLLRQGSQEGVFRSDVDPLHLHLLIISLCYHRVSNRHTGKLFSGETSPLRGNSGCSGKWQSKLCSAI